MTRRTFKHQYRVVWRYVGERTERQYVANTPSRALRMLRRVGTDEPWLGVTAGQLRRSWMWLSHRIHAPFAAVANIRPRDVLVALQGSFPALEYIRVEVRQVAAWVDLLDPLESLRTARTAKADQQMLATLKEVEDMDRATLDVWRHAPPEDTLD